MKCMAQSGCAKKSKGMEKEIKAENVLFPVSYTLIVVVSVLILSMAFAGIVSADNEVIETTVLPLTSEEKGLDSKLSEGGKSRFAEPDLWVGTGEDIVPGTSKGHSAKLIAEYYRPRLYLGPLSDQCPDEVYYRVIKGKDSYVGFDAYLIQYFAYWNYQSFPEHVYDFEPIFIYVRNIGEKPYRVAYDRCDIADMTKHYHEIHRTYSCINPEDGPRDEDTHTNDKAYYPYGRRDYTAKVDLSDISTSLKDNWAGNQVKLGIAHTWHTFNTDISDIDIECPYCELEPLTDGALEKAYLLKRDIVEPFKYDISDPFKNLFWEDHYHLEDLKFPTISGNIKSAVVNNEILTVKVSMLYDNTGAGGSSGKHLTGLWVDRFDAKISTDTGYEDIGDPYEFDEQSPGEYILKYDVSGIDINSVLNLKVRDNVGDFGDPGDSCDLYKHITFVSAEVYVPDDYPTIQAAVDAVNAGDTIIVRDGTYTENVDVDKSLTIKSENGADSTIVQAANPNDHVFEVTADDVTISRFMVTGARKFYAGIYLGGPDNCIITDNKATDNDIGIYLDSSSNNNIRSNNANSNNWHGIYLSSSNYNMITNNDASHNRYREHLASGIILLHSSSNTVSNNCVDSNNGYGIGLYYSNSNSLLKNSAKSNCDAGIHLSSSENNSVKDNKIESTFWDGIVLGGSFNNMLRNNTVKSSGRYCIYGGSANRIYFNNFIDNNNVNSGITNYWNSPEQLTYTYNDNTYTNHLGNYWDDYTDIDANNDGIWDNPYSINSDNDNYPLVERFENYEIGEDTTPPTVTTVSPQNGAPDVAIDTVVTATFSEAMDSSTITTDSFTLAGSAVSGTVTYDSDTYTATFTPNANLEYNHEYNSALSTAITDKAGNPLAEEGAPPFK